MFKKICLGALLLGASPLACGTGEVRSGVDQLKATSSVLGDECDHTGECRQIYGSVATDCANSPTDHSVCMCGDSPCLGTQSPVVGAVTDQCDTTGECREIYGSVATDCANSPTDQSVCMCGDTRCDSLSNPAGPDTDGGDDPIPGPAQTRAEAESVPLSGSWVRETATAGFSGAAYYRWAGDDVYSEASISAGSVLTYSFSVSTEGEYQIMIRSRRDKTGDGSCRCSGDGNCDDECNDLWLRVNGEPWMKKMAAGSWGTWTDNKAWQLNHHPTGVTLAEAHLRRGVNTLEIAGRSRDVKVDYLEVVDAPKYRSGDLVSIHHDNAADIDDSLATAANFTLVQEFGISALVVNGTYGWQGDVNVTCSCGRTGMAQAQFNLNSDAVMDAVWGRGNWLNAHEDWSGSVQTAAARWLSTLNNGGTVWVAEAGQSDFTVAVIKRVRTLGFLNTVNRVRVVQHSIWNEEYTGFGASNLGLAYLQWYQGGRASYVRIGDGNSVTQKDSWDDPTADRPTHTADLSMKSDVTDTAGFRRQATNSAYAAAWVAAFAYFDDLANWSGNYPRPNYVDFSDTVELLYIIGVPVAQVGDIQDFADVYLSN